jgi:hypothetical protein
LLEELNLGLGIHLSLCSGLALVDLGLLCWLELFQGSYLNCGILRNTGSWLIIVVVATFNSFMEGSLLLVGGDGGHIPSRNALFSALFPSGLLLLFGHTLPDSSCDIGTWVVFVKLVGFLGELAFVRLTFLGAVFGLSRRLGIGLGLGVGLSRDCSHRPIGPSGRCVQGLKTSYLPSQEITGASC